MKKNTIENITEYAKNATVIEEPAEYSTGVKVGWTAPAKWWNWLMNAFSRRLGETYETVKSIHEEIKNAVGGTLDENSNTQLKDKFDAIYNEKGTADGFATLDNTGVLTGIQRPLATVNSLGCLCSDTAKSLKDAKSPAAGDFYGSAEVPFGLTDTVAGRIYYNYLFVGTSIAKFTLTKQGFPVITKLPMANSNTLRAVAGYSEAYTMYKQYSGGIAVGDNGTIVDININNDTVNILPSPTTEKLNGVAVLGDTLNATVYAGYIAVGNNGTLIIDGKKIETAVTANFTAVCVNKNKSAFGIVADDGSVYIYNGALAKVVDGNDTALRCICPSSENSSSFVAAGDSGYCISFSMTGSSRITGISKNVTGISAMLKDTRHIYVLVGDGFAYKYTASGGFEIIQGAEGSLKTVFSHQLENGTSEEVIAAGIEYLIEDMISESSAAVICRFPYKTPNTTALDVVYNCAITLASSSTSNIVLLAGNAKQLLVVQMYQYVQANTSMLPQFPILASGAEIIAAYSNLDTSNNTGRYILVGKSSSLGYIVASSYSYADSTAVMQGAINTDPIRSAVIVGDTMTAGDKIYFGTISQNNPAALYRMGYSSTDKTPDTDNIEKLVELDTNVVKLVMFNSNLYILTVNCKLYRYTNLSLLETVMSVTELNTTVTDCFNDNDCLLITCEDGHIIRYTADGYSIIDTGYSIKLNCIYKYKGLYVVACDDGIILYSLDLQKFNKIHIGSYNLKVIAEHHYRPYFDALIIAGAGWSAVYTFTVDDSYNLVVLDTGLATIPALEQFEKRIAALEAKG